MKKIIFIICCMFIIILIYVLKTDKKVIYLEITDKKIIGDEAVKYLSSKKILENNIYYQSDRNYKLINLYNDINSNIKLSYNNKDYRLNNLFIKSKYIVLNIGNNDLCDISKSDLEPLQYLDMFVNEYENIIKSIRSESKENIIIIFDYNLNAKYKYYLYNKMKLLTNKYEVYMIYKNELIKYIKKLSKG